MRHATLIPSIHHDQPHRPGEAGSGRIRTKTSKNSPRKPQDSESTLLGENRKASHLYVIEETLEAGIVLFGSEVRSLRSNRASLSEGFVVAKRNSLVLQNITIAHYRYAPAPFQHDPHRPRTLLIHRREFNRLAGKVRMKGMTLVPLKMYSTKRGLIKLLIGLAKGKSAPDRRQDEKKRDWERTQRRLLRRGADTRSDHD